MSDMPTGWRPKMRCCDAPDYAYTTISEEEVRDIEYRTELVAVDVRRSLFTAYVARYQQVETPVLDFARRMAHKWIDPETGKLMGAWHWLEVTDE